MGDIDSMKYVVTQKQIDGLRESIINYLDSNLTPFGGWMSRREYIKELNENSGELFLFFEEGDGDIQDANEDAHMWYSMCDNGNLSEPLAKGTCPVVAIYSAKYDALEAFFGDVWKPIFKQWFKQHTGLPVKHVDVQDW
jgi:hypothetical protein